MKNKYKGFTLIEVTLSIILIAILISITTPLVSSIAIRNDLSSAHETLYNALLRAQQLSKTNYKNSQWRVCINNTTKTYTITAGTCASNLYPETLKINSGVEVSSTQALDIPFKSIGGELDYNNNFIRVNLSGGGVSKSILITKDGVIDKVSTTDPAITTIVQNGLVLHLDAGNTASYPGTGTTWTDLSGNGNNGTLVNGVGYNSGNGGSLSFNGVNTYVSVSNSSSLNPSTNTLICWAKSNTSTWNDNGFLISKRNVFIIHPNVGQNTVSYYYFINNSWWSQSVTVPNIMNWNMYASSWDGTIITAYLNGSKVGMGSLVGAINTSDNGVTLIGKDDDFNRYLNGNISSCLMYNRALSDSEIQQNFNATKGRFGL